MYGVYLYPQTPAYFNRAYLFYGRFAHFKCTATKTTTSIRQPIAPLQQPWLEANANIIGPALFWLLGDNGGGIVALIAFAVILVRRSFWVTTVGRWVAYLLNG
uniref:Uncharacterized protein n=1 Tax=Ceratitis capitata TaxID=7213 RepID=W8BZJ5_CERCA